MAKERRLRELGFEIRDAEREMDDELEKLRQRKYRSANNLAGATWESSISQERCRQPPANTWPASMRCAARRPAFRPVADHG
jgi:hypothetical protein